MRINSIHLQNFRQFIDEKIEFSSTPDKKVSVIYGRNYIGKTTLIKALLWCLYQNDESFKEDPIHINRDKQTGYASVGDKIVSSVTIELEHNDYNYTIRTFQTYQYQRTPDGQQKFIPLTKDPFRQIIKTDPEGNPIPMPSETVNREIESILPSNLRNYFFYDGENNKIDSVASKANLKEAVRSIMNLNIREDLIKIFSPTNTSTGVRARFSSQMQTADRERADEIQEEIDSLNAEIENDEKNNETARGDIEKLQNQADELEARIAASADAETYQRNLTQARRDLENLKLSRDADFTSLCQNLDTMGGTHPGLASLFIGQVLQRSDLGDKFSNIKITQRAYSHQSEDSVKEIIKKGVCICGEPIKEGDAHYLHLIEAMEYLAPRDYSAMLNGFLKTFNVEYESAKRGGQELHRIASSLKLTVKAIEEKEETINELIKKLEGFDGDVGEWRRRANNLIYSIKEKEANLNYSEKTLLPQKRARVEKLLQNKEKLASTSAKNQRLQKYIAYVDAVYNLASRRLDQKKVGIVDALQQQANEVFQGILGKKEKELYLNPDTYTVEIRQKGVRITNSTAEGIAKNLGFVAGLIYLAKNKNLIGSGDGDEDLPDDYPLFIDAPFSELDEQNVRNAAKILPQFCSQLVITLLDKDYNIAKEPLQPYIDETYHLTTNTTATVSKFDKEGK